MNIIILNTIPIIIITDIAIKICLKITIVISSSGIITI